MSAAEKLRLRKELEKHHGFVASLKRDEFQKGTWFEQFVERTLASYTEAPTPDEVREEYGEEGDDEDDVADTVTTRTIHEAIAATDAVEENLTSTEIRNLRERRPGGDQQLRGDTVALLAELSYTVLLNIHMIFRLAAAYNRQMNAGQTDIVEEAMGRGLGAFNFDEAKEAGDLGRRIGEKIFQRAIVTPFGTDYADAQRKGFYCYYTKAVSKVARDLVQNLPEYVPPAPETGAMTVADGAFDDGGMMT